MSTKTLGTQIKEYREKHGLSQASMEKELGIPRTTLSNYERGTYIPSKEREAQLIAYMSKGVDEQKASAFFCFYRASKAS